MDALAGLLDGPRARGAFLIRSILTPPWSVRIQDRAPITLLSMLSSESWIMPDNAAPAKLAPGDVAIMRGPDDYTAADDPATAPQFVIHPGERSTDAQGQEVCEVMDLGVRTWGEDPDGPVVLISGTYEMGGEISGRLLRALPPMLIVRKDDLNSPLLPLLANEMVKDEPGQEVFLDRLLDLLLISTLRAWFSGPEAEAPAWYQAHSDPLVGPALRLLQDNPAHPWTVALLASKIGVSRAAFARRFNDLVGEPPMTYLTNWRLARAADLLREPDATLASVARRVGYSTPFALSTAFKRVRGVSPQSYRSEMTDTEPVKNLVT